MSLTLGPNHTTSSPAVFTIARPLGLSIHLSNIPNYVPAMAGAPLEYHGIGRINLGNSLGYMTEIPLRLVNQLVLDLPDELTLMNVNPRSGMQVSIDEIVRPAVLNSALMPWDRTPVPVVNLSPSVMSGVVADTTVINYTVPAGKLLLLQRLILQLNRLTVATTPNEVDAWWLCNGSYVSFIRLTTNAVGVPVDDQGGMAGVILRGGDTLVGHFQSAAVAGTVACSIGFMGTQFSA